MLNITKPDEAQLAALLAQHAHRRPEKARFTVPGDGEVDLVLPVLLGLPSGACKMPADAIVSAAWGETVASVFKMRTNTQTVPDELASDCVLWPDAGTWATWTSRWPALAVAAQNAVRKKCGAMLAQFDEPAKNAAVPDPVRTLLASAPSSVWRSLMPPGRQLVAVVRPPDAGVWRLFSEAMKKRDAKSADLVRELSTASLVACFDEGGAPITADELFGEWPGMAILIGLTASHLAGIAASYALGEW